MTINIPIDSMSVSEKLRVVEMVWDSLRQTPDEMPSPDWHADELALRKQRLANGEATLLSWDDAKKRLNDLGS